MSPMLMRVPASADAAQSQMGVVEPRSARARDEDSDFLYRCIEAAYRFYHQADSYHVVDREGRKRLRLAGPIGSDKGPRGRYISVDLEDFQ